ncbi:hypothetical protein FRIGORI9N_420128 [Frigoribacterium sp. 9N]|nr:hypothetical protein FRIGORI9N_420128 [Frigoribacterium sp. 9N]
MLTTLVKGNPDTVLRAGLVNSTQQIETAQRTDGPVTARPVKALQLSREVPAGGLFESPVQLPDADAQSRLPDEG